MNFADFKKKQVNLSESIDKLKNLSKSSYIDERVWNLKKDAAGNALATIRFLPQKDLANAPIILLNRHSFQVGGKWFIDDCPVTIGKECPVCEHSSAIWKSDEDRGRMFWRKKTYISNILVIEDSAAPENNGKVFIFKYGVKIYEKLMEAISPEDKDETGVNIFDFDEGLNFKLKLTQVGGHNNYDKSKFVTLPSAIGNGDIKVQEEVYNQIYDLTEFVDPTKFKSYDDLLKKFKNMIATPGLNKSYSDKVETEKKEKIETPPEETKKETEETSSEEFDFDALLNDDDMPF